MRTTQTLNGAWRCLPDRENRGTRLGYHKVEYDYLDKIGFGYGEEMWREVNIPCCYTHCGPDMRQYVGMAWFRRSFDVPADWRDKHVFIRFEALNFRSRIWVNNSFVKTGYDGLLRYDVPLNGFLRFGEENTIIVTTDNSENPDDRSPGKVSPTISAAASSATFHWLSRTERISKAPASPSPNPPATAAGLP